jgi:DNA-binding CsgD family transcriptional regulator
MKKIIILTFLAFRFSCSFGQEYREVIAELEKTLDKKEIYIEQKETTIQKKKDTLHIFEASNNLREQILVSLELVYEYQSFVYDSAQYYVNKAKSIAYQIKDASLISQIKIREGFVLLSSGLFKEAIDTLHSVSPVFLNDSLKSLLYSTLARAYYDIADYVRDPVYMPEYISRGNTYIDSALFFATPYTNEFWAIKSLQRIKKSDWSGAKYIFEYWINNFDLPRHHYAIATSSLGYIYQMTGFPDQAIKYFALAAIADVKTATMETVALRNLANLFYEKGEERRAYRYIIEALNQASYYNARHRQLEIGQILPIIERDRMDMIKKQRDRTVIFSCFVSVLLIALIVVLRRLNIARLIIRKSNEKLTEANKIKDEYIADFFNQNSEYIEKIEHLQKWFNRMVVTKQFEALRKLPEYINIQNEREVLYERFDRMFLKLFPDFVEEFNKLLVDGEQIQVKDDQLMNMDLRIYALIRLGINDNEKIASFLNFSVNTVYTYKTKIKGKARNSSEQFKQQVMDIKSI